VRDPEGLDTSATWTVTVLEVNVAPEITDSSPAGNNLVMNENEVRKFSVVDSAIDGDKLTVTWFLDGVNTGTSARSYDYRTDYNSSGQHYIEVEVSDGKLSAKRRWDLTVNDVNRPPVAIIDSPKAGAEYMTWDDIALTATSTMDPDNDALNLSWSEGNKVYGYGNSITARLGRGKHLLTLTVSDGKKNGVVTAQVEVTVRYLSFSALLQPDDPAPFVGHNVKLAVQLTNEGDGNVAALPVYFLVDGVEVGSQNLENVQPNTDYPLEFSWKAVKGDHRLVVRVNDQNFSRVLTVSPKPAPAPPVSIDLMPVIAAVVVVAAAVGVGALVYSTRRKDRAAAGQRVSAVPAAAAAVPAAVPAAAPAPGLAGLSQDAQARELIQKTEAAFAEFDKVGLDTSKARQTLAIAKNFNEMGKYPNAIEYCKKAQDMVG